MIDQARRYGRIGGVDLALAEKVVGAGANGRAATIEWDPVDQSHRMAVRPRDRHRARRRPISLINAASPQLRAFQARAPLLTSSATAAFGNDCRRPGRLLVADAGRPLFGNLRFHRPQRSAGHRRVAVAPGLVGKDADTRLARHPQIAGAGKDGLQKEAARALVARAATLIAPDAKLAKDAPDLIAAMLAGGYDQAAARWIPAVNGMDDEDADRCWAMLALAAPNVADVGTSRITSFIRRDKSRDHVRSALLVAGLAGLGRISTDTANSLNRRYGLGLGHSTSWTRMIDAAADRGQGGTVLVLTGTGFQTPNFDRVPVVASLSRGGGAEPDRAEFHCADDRRRGAVANVMPRQGVIPDDRALVDRFLDMMAAEAGSSAPHARGLSQRSRTRRRIVGLAGPCFGG